MLCRGLLAAIALTYLVCVLFLSGIQKEDLEVSLLKKMKHYNINYDKNNEDLRKECLNNTEIKANSENKTIEKENVTSTTTTTTTTTSTTLVPILDTSELESVMKYLKHKKKMRNPTTTDATTSTSEITEMPRHLLETLMSEFDKHFRQTQETHETSQKESGLEDLNKYLLPFTKKLDQLISRTNIKPENRTTSPKQATQNNKDATEESVKNNVFKNIQQIGKDLDILLSKKSTVPPKTTAVELITMKFENNITLKPQISQDMENKFILGIAAINKLNENIANLQKSFNEPKFEESKYKFTSQINIQNQTEDITNKLPNSDGNNNQIQQTANIISVPKFVATDNYINNPAASEKSLPNLQPQSDYLQNSQSGFIPKITNYWDPTQYENLRYSDSLLSAKNYPNQPTYYTKDMITASDSDNIKNDGKMDHYSPNFKKNIDYNKEKEINFGKPNVSQNQKIDAPMIYIPAPQTQNVINNGYYSTKQSPNNNIHNIQYNTDAGTIQGENQNTLPYNINLEMLQNEPYVPAIKKNANNYKNNQMQYSDAKQLVQEQVLSNIEKKAILDTYSIQNSQPYGYYDDNQELVDSQTLNPKIPFFNADMNKVYSNREPINDPTNGFQMEMVKRFAEAVKDIVLKDINKTMTPNYLIPLTTTTFTPVTTTISTPVATTATTTVTTAAQITTEFSSSALTTSEPTMSTAPTCTSTSANLSIVATNGDQTKSKKNDENKELAAALTIEKFMQLFEHMKTAQIPIKSSEMITKLQNQILPKHNAPVNMYPPAKNPRALKQMPLIIHNYVPPGPMSGPIFPPNFGPRVDTKNSMSPKHSIATKHLNYIQPRYPVAVMIQTNTQEIKPLGIPMLKPESLNMNIIVTTPKPWRDTRNQMNYVYRQPDKNTQFSFNVYSNNKVKVHPMENKDLYVNTAQGLTNSNLPVNDYMKMKMLPQLDSYNEQFNAEKVTNKQKNNGILVGKLIHPSIIQNNGLINQMAKINQPMIGFPYNNPIFNRYKIPNISPNLMYEELQKASFANQMHNTQDSNVFRQNIKLPGDIQYGNYIEKNIAGRNEMNNFHIFPDLISKPPLKTNINDQLNNIIEICKNIYANPNFASQVQNVDALKSYCNQLNLHHTAKDDPFKAMPSYRVKYSDASRPSFEQIMQNRPKYLSEIGLSSDDDVGNRDSFRNLEKYLDSPPVIVDRMEAMKMRQKALLKQASDYSRPLYQNSKIEKDLTMSSTSINKIKKKYESPAFYRSLSEEDPNRESQRTNIDLINAVLGKRNRQKENRERLHTENSDINCQSCGTKVHTVPLESTESDKHGTNGRGFREKVDSKGVVEQSNSAIQARELKPLGNKEHQYDSERFNKFLNTQKKVNRMLEMILGSEPDRAKDSASHKPDLFEDTAAHGDEFNIIV